MRSEKEMLELILNIARNDDNVRAVLMNGSRVNPNVKKDPFQDFDIIYFVTDVGLYRRNQRFVGQFGDLMIVQMPEDMSDPPADQDGHYAYLMQFLDGNRIDLSFFPLEQIAKHTQDSLSVTLLDKDNLIPELPAPSDRDYLPQKPTAKLFDDCCNEFWWVSTYVGKGLWRDELTYAKYMLDSVVREELMKMLIWYFGIQTDFQKSPGKAGKYLEQFLDPQTWKLLERTYSDAELEHIWESVFVMGDLFRQTGRYVAEHFGFNYPQKDDENVTRYLHYIRKLPNDSEFIY